MSCEVESAAEPVVHNVEDDQVGREGEPERTGEGIVADLHLCESGQLEQSAEESASERVVGMVEGVQGGETVERVGEGPEEGFVGQVEVGEVS